MRYIHVKSLSWNKIDFHMHNYTTYQYKVLYSYKFSLKSNNSSRENVKTVNF